MVRYGSYEVKIMSQCQIFELVIQAICIEEVKFPHIRMCVIQSMVILIVTFLFQATDEDIGDNGLFDFEIVDSWYFYK